MGFAFVGKLHRRLRHATYERRPAPQAIAPELIERHLASILRSAEFTRSSRLSQLLRFIVETVRSEPGCEISERLLAERVFDKDATWDPKADPVVRITFSRLRDKLKRYYQFAPHGEALRIDLPPGTYAPSIVGMETAPPPVPIPLISPRYAPLAMAAAAVAILGIAGGLRPGAGAVAASFHSIPFATEAGFEISPVLHPQGNSLLYSWNREGDQFDIYRKPIDGGEPERLTSGPGSKFYPSWSPDGSRVAFLRVAHETEVVVLDLATRSLVIVDHFPIESGAWTGEQTGLLGSPGPSWTPDGTALLVSRSETASPSGQAIWRITIATGDKTRILSSTGISRDFWPRLSPDGRHLAFVRYTSHGVGELHTFDLQTKQLRQLTFDNRTICGAIWNPRGTALTFSSNRDGSFQL